MRRDGTTGRRRDSRAALERWHRPALKNDELPKDESRHCEEGFAATVVAVAIAPSSRSQLTLFPHNCELRLVLTSAGNDESQERDTTTEEMTITMMMMMARRMKSGEPYSRFLEDSVSTSHPLALISFPLCDVLRVWFLLCVGPIFLVAETARSCEVDLGDHEFMDPEVSSMSVDQVVL